MYAGVLIGSGKWITRMEGKPCDLGDNVSCINQTVEISLETEQESYGTEAFVANMTSFRNQIEGGIVGQEAIEAMVRSAFPDDIYLQNPTGIIIEDVEVGIYAID